MAGANAFVFVRKNPGKWMNDSKLPLERMQFCFCPAKKAPARGMFSDGVIPILILPKANLPNMSAATRMLKIKPFEDFVGNDCAVSYIGIRADENRKGYISTKKNITAC